MTQQVQIATDSRFPDCLPVSLWMVNKRLDTNSSELLRLSLWITPGNLERLALAVRDDFSVEAIHTEEYAEHGYGILTFDLAARTVGEKEEERLIVQAYTDDPEFEARVKLILNSGFTFASC